MPEHANGLFSERLKRFRRQNGGVMKKNFARCFGQDLMRKEHVLKELGGGKLMPSITTEKFSPHGNDLFGNPIVKQMGKGRLSGRFMISPFSVLSARDGDWQERKRAWLGLGIKSEIGRGGGCNDFPASVLSLSGGWAQNPAHPELRSGNHFGRRSHGGSMDELPGREPGTDYEGGDAWVASKNGSGTSIFDPVLCEIIYRWFCPPGGQIVDPFAGGSVRGIVASLMGYCYHGIELREEQVAANRVQANEICQSDKPRWECGDAMELLPLAPEADLIFSCPPYGDLEVYSDDPRDLSTMEYNTFCPTYKRIILRSLQRLKPSRFACFVVGDFRDKRTGNYRNFVGDTVRGFIDAGAGLYNEAILLTAVGSLPIRVGKQFAASRKLGKTHQNVLVFVKGEGKLAAAACEQNLDKNADSQS